MTRPQYGSLHQRTSRQLRAEHVRVSGWWCPGDPDYDHPMHESTDLVADHLVPGDASKGYRVCCRVLNSMRARG